MAYRDDLSAALARAEAAERRLEGVCAVHGGAPSTAECTTCKRSFCDACVSTTADGPMCTTCFVAHTSRAKRRRLIAIAVGVAVAGGGVGAYAHFGKRWKHDDDVIARALPTPQVHEKAKYSRMPNKIRLLREALLADPCNRDAAQELADLLNENQAYDETLASNQKFLAKCGAFPHLVWSSVFAHEQRHEWTEAVARATELISDEPTDSDFWWWRGQDRAELGQLDTAIADYRQSMALGGERFATFRLADVTERKGQPCEGAFAIRYLTTVDGRELAGDTWRRFDKLWTAGACDAVNGKGKAVLKLKPGVDLVPAEVKIGAVAGSFIVESAVPYLTLSAEMATKAGIQPAADAVKVTSLILGELREGRLAVADAVDLGGATSTLVPVMVVDTLPPGMDGIVGLSFLWRFAVARDEAQVVLTGWE